MVLFAALLSILSFTVLSDSEHKSDLAFADNSLASLYNKTTSNASQTIPKNGQTEIPNLPDELLVNPGLYNVSGSPYDMDYDGLYDLVLPNAEPEQRIVYSGNIDALLSSMAQIDSHGYSDDKMNFTDLNEVALHSDIYTTCGTVSKWAHMTLSNLGISSRIVLGITLDPLNGMDDGHTMIEVYRPDYQKWVLYDIDNKAYFEFNGKPLSFYEFANHVQQGDYEIKFLAYDGTVPVDTYNQTSGAGFVGEENIPNKEQALKNWYKRVIGIPLIGDDHYFYYFDTQNMTRVSQEQSNSYYMYKDDFLENFYDQNVDLAQYLWH